MRVRAARASDAPAVVAIDRAALPDANAPVDVEAALARPDRSLAVAVTGEGCVVGFVLGSLAAGEFEIHALAVKSGDRRQGVGRALLAHALDCAARSGARTAFLEVRAGDTGARAFYRERRFREIGRRPRYYRDGEDAILMSREIGS